MQKLKKGAAQYCKISTVGFQVIRFDIGHHCDHGLQVQKGGVTFIGLGNQNTTGTQLRVAAYTVYQAPNNKGRVQPSLSQDRCDQAGRCRLTVCAGDGDAVAIAHQFCQHLCARHHRNPCFSGGDHLRILLLHRAGTNDDIGAANVLGRMADKYFYTSLDEALGNGSGAQVRASNLVAQVHKNFSDTTHARPADTNHMNTANAAHFREAVCIAAIRHTSAPHSSH